MEILMDSGSKMVEAIQQFVDGETGKRPMLEPLLPVDGIQVASFRQMAEGFAAQVLANVDKIDVAWRKKGEAHVDELARKLIETLKEESKSPNELRMEIA